MHRERKGEEARTTLKAEYSRPKSTQLNGTDIWGRERETLTLLYLAREAWDFQENQGAWILNY